MRSWTSKGNKLNNMKNGNEDYLKNKTLSESFQNAASGFRQAVISERNMRIHLLSVLLVVRAGIFFKIDSVRWAVLMLAIGLVLVCELINTSIEELTDMVTTEYSDKAKNVKDIGAAAVLVASVISVIVGVMVLCRPILNFIIKLRF